MPERAWRRASGGAIALLAGIAATVWVAPVSGALPVGTYYASPSGSGSACSSSSPCSLSTALAQAGSGEDGSGQVLYSGGTVLAAAGTYPAGLALDATAGPVTVQGSASASTIAGGGLTGPLLSITGTEPVTLDALSFTGGAAGVGQGGDVDATGGQLTVVDSTFSSSFAPNGGAVAFAPSVPGVLGVEGSTFVGNTAAQSGGAVFVGTGSTAAIEGSTFVNDGASSSSGDGAVAGSGISLQADIFANDGAVACPSSATVGAGVLVADGACAGARATTDAALFPGGSAVLG
ncbi:MAG: right-handed parallel beta-helix repeat-containing protein, partial [Acidimicrobiaceae bacterium]|nr:right-handed parallel beta-helix repeat-containing protein [Acidimicrobiaceae bacterium]